jgi:hypothetical protein
MVYGGVSAYDEVGRLSKTRSAVVENFGLVKMYESTEAVIHTPDSTARKRKHGV